MPSGQDAVETVFQVAHLDPATVRRALRDRLGRGHHDYRADDSGFTPRSVSSRNLVDWAEIEAQARGAEEATALDLLAVSLDWPSNPLTSVLQDLGSSLDRPAG